ncbi:MAG: hypothetical protein ACD_20C00099G0015 [uncultured bacterium]|nr:MAG: hypothetical protein ACD_20C00099G0015 [uncultured bacterium]HBH18504.1 hypothetical protein [Cyanobacteria bacterium UBA9579]
MNVQNITPTLPNNSLQKPKTSQPKFLTIKKEMPTAAFTGKVNFSKLKALAHKLKEAIFKAIENSSYYQAAKIKSHPDQAGKIVTEWLNKK